MKSDEKRDNVFAKNMVVGDFKFDEKVAKVFDDMLLRSVPFYRETQDMALRLVLNFIKKNSNVYDIGCSTGTLIKNLSNLIQDKSVKLIGLDNSAPMLDKAKEKLSNEIKEGRVDLKLSDISENLPIENASVIMMNYVLQFIRPLHRDTLVKQIYEGLNENGCLILVEKVLGNDSLFNRMYIDLYYEFKKKQGYSENELSRKREALENVLIPYRIDENIDLLKKSGFTTIDIFFKWYNFAGFIAVK